MVRADGEGAIVLGADGRRRLRDDEVTGEDPLRDFGANAADHLRRTDGFPHCPDILVNCLYDPRRTRSRRSRSSWAPTAGSAAGRAIPSRSSRPTGASRRSRSSASGRCTTRSGAGWTETGLELKPHSETRNTKQEGASDDQEGRFHTGGVGHDRRGADRRRVDRLHGAARRHLPRGDVDGKAYTEARKQHGESELLDELVNSKPEIDRSRHGSVEELKAANLQRLRDAVALLEQKASPEEVEDYRGFVLALAERVADAKDEGDGDAESEAERAAIAEISEALGAAAPERAVPSSP